jgi:histidinol-phosphatase (PHP family)
VPIKYTKSTTLKAKRTLLQNLHTHTRFSDGSDEPVVYIQEAIRQGFSSLGFSDHSPLPFENTFALKHTQVESYCKSILSLKALHPEIEIFLGMEVDFINGLGYSPRYFLDKYPLDYVIGSVHLVRNPEVEALWFIDGPLIKTFDDGLVSVFNGDGRKGVTAYYRQIQEMVTNHKPDIIGHLDKVKMHNHDRFFSETDGWYVAIIDETLEIIRDAGCVVEVNTRGVYKNRSMTFFPGPAILKKINDLKIPVTISSDAHKPYEISLLFEEVRLQLKELGFTGTMVKTGTGWSKLPV